MLEFPAFCFNSHLFTGNRKGIERNNMTYETIKRLRYSLKCSNVPWNTDSEYKEALRGSYFEFCRPRLFFFFFLLIFIVQAGSFETSLNKLQRSSARKILSVVPFTGFFEELENKKLKSTKLKFPVYYFADWTIYYFDFVQRKRNRSRNCLLSENVTNCRNNLIKAKSYLFESVNWVTELINNGQRSWTFRV